MHINSHLDLLADALVANHLRLTFLDQDGELRKAVLDERHKDVASQDGRVVVVVGAGASAAAHVPTTTQAIEVLNRAVSHAGRGDLRQMAADKYGRTPHPAPLETLLQAACENDLRRVVQDTLQKLFNIRHRPTITYEILAHLLKHRFVDAIVNFNFDEVLDQSVEDELGTGRYHHIVSDGDCRLVEWTTPPRRCPKPIYVKPHGTASAPATMRFTLPDYHGVTTPVKELLKVLLSHVRVTLIVIGFNMQSMEFNEIVDDCMTHPDCSIYNLTLSCDPRPSPYASEHCLQLYDKGGHIAVGDGETALDYHVAELWSRIVQRFGTNFTPRSIARHKLIAKLDGCNDGYLKHRAAIEVALAAAKAKGLVTTRTLLNGRAGKYLRLYHDAEEAAPNDPWRTIYQLCVQLGLQECSFSREVLSLAGAGEQARPQAMDYDTFMGSPLDGLIARLKDAGAIIDERELREALGEMHRGDEVEVVPPRLTAGLELCAQPTFFSTLTALRAYTAREIESSAYTTLLCVAETGKWLVSAAAAIPQDRHVGLIVADVSQMRRIGEAYHGRLCKPEKPLPWWLHNQHMTIFVQDRVARKAIHFERRLRSPRIAPVVVEGMDAEYLMDYFFAYWVKAESAAGGHITRDAINAAKEKFFRDV